MLLKASSAEWGPFCLGLNVLTPDQFYHNFIVILHHTHLSEDMIFLLVLGLEALWTEQHQWALIDFEMLGNILVESVQENIILTQLRSWKNW